MPWFRTHLKELKSLSLATIAKHFEIQNKQAHDALADSITLKQACEALAKRKILSMSTLTSNEKSFQLYFDDQDGKRHPS